MAEINERIRKIREYYCENNNTLFAQKLGYSTQFSSGICRGDSVGNKVINNIITAFPDVSKSWLVTGEGEMLKTQKANVSGHHNTTNIAGRDLTVMQREDYMRMVEDMQEELKRLRKEVETLLEIIRNQSKL